MNLTVDEIIAYLDSFTPNDIIKNPTDIMNPNYTIYGCAPYWTDNQAICLLAGLKTIDENTLTTILNFNKAHLAMNRELFNKSKDEPSGQHSFHEFVISNFPIPHGKINYLRNLQKKLKEANPLCMLFKKKEVIEGQSKMLLYPLDLIRWAEDEEIPIPDNLLHALSFRNKLNLLYLPDIFPNEVNIYKRWIHLRIKYNLSKPVPIGSPESFSNQDSAKFSQEKRKIFISYDNSSKSDCDLACALYERLTSHNIDTWLDKINIKFGSSITTEIQEGLARSEFIIIVLSPTFISNRRYANKEYKAAVQLCLRDPNKKLLPIWKDIRSEQVSNYDASLADISAEIFSESQPMDPQVDNIVKAILEWF